MANLKTKEMVEIGNLQGKIYSEVQSELFDITMKYYRIIILFQYKVI